MKLKLLIIFMMIHFIIFAVHSEEDCESHSTTTLRLKCKLFKNYDPEERPVENYYDKLKINLEMLPTDINLNDRNDKFGLSTWMEMNWTDVFLNWNPDDYGGLNQIKIECDKIWKPDLISLSLYAEETQQIVTGSECRINSTGLVYHKFKTTYSTYCNADRTYWPYDEHICIVNLGSKFTAKSLIYNLKEIMPDNLKNNKNWIVRDIQPSNLTITDKNFTYTRMDFKFILKRNYSMYTVIYVIPTAGTALTTLAILWLDIMSPERIYMFAVIMYQLDIYLESFNFEFPASGTKPPILINILRDMIIMCGIGIVTTIIGRQLIGLTSKPLWLNEMIRWLNGKKQIFSYFYINLEPENNETQENDEESPSTISTVNKREKEWIIFVTCVDRFIFMLFSLVFLYYLLRYSL